jgi:transposase
MESKHPSSRRYPAELKERAVRLVEQTRAEGGDEVGVIARVARQLGVGDQSLRNWVRQAEIDSGRRQGLSSDERARLKALEKENRELRRANEILKSAATFFGAELCATRRRVDRGGVRDLSRRAVAAAR